VSILKKLTQMAAFFTQREGGKINASKLMGLIYLTDREALWQMEAPVSMDRPVATPEGPGPSTLVELLHGRVRSAGLQPWHEWFSTLESREIVLKHVVEKSRLTALNENDFKIMGEVWNNFGKATPQQLAAYLCEACPEFQPPLREIEPIDERDILVRMGRSLEAADLIVRDLDAFRQLEQSFGG
jgi:hypothetical protein